MHRCNDQRGDKYESFDHMASIRRIQSRGAWTVNTFRTPPEKPANISNANSIKRRRIRMRRNSVRIGPLFLTNLVSNSVEIVAGPRRGKTRGMRGRKSREERSPHNRVISSLNTGEFRYTITRIPRWKDRRVAVRVAPWPRNFSSY